MPSTRISEAHAGRVALVTGAARGIGQAIAVGLAERGARIVLGDLGDMSETSNLVAGTGQPALPVRLDVSDPASIEAARSRVADELGRVDILVNNAGIFEAAAWDDLDRHTTQLKPAAGEKRHEGVTMPTTTDRTVPELTTFRCPRVPKPTAFQSKIWPRVR